MTFHLFQISDLLTSMGLEQYVETFARERIDGALLLELDDNMLQKDLNVHVSLHRIRLQKVISGKQSASNILQGQDPYIP